MPFSLDVHVWLDGRSTVVLTEVKTNILLPHVTL
jgi:hypothetical protein